jgi:hypothetical protein
MSVLKQISKTDPSMMIAKDPNFSMVSGRSELFDLLQGMMRSKPSEFGRFNDLQFTNLSYPSAARYSPKGVIRLNTDYTSGGRLSDFLHELTHARQFTPDSKELQFAKDLMYISDRVPYKDQPIEMMADKMARLATPNPNLFDDYYKQHFYDNDIIEKVTSILKNPSSMSETPANPPWVSYIKPYTRRGWLYSGAGVGMARTGED